MENTKNVINKDNAISVSALTGQGTAFEEAGVPTCKNFGIGIQAQSGIDSNAKRKESTEFDFEMSLANRTITDRCVSSRVEQYRVKKKFQLSQSNLKGFDRYRKRGELLSDGLMLACLAAILRYNGAKEIVSFKSGFEEQDTNR